VIAVHLSCVHLASLYRSPARLSLKSKASVPSATRCLAVVSMYLSRGFWNGDGLDSQKKKKKKKESGKAAGRGKGLEPGVSGCLAVMSKKKRREFGKGDVFD